MGITIRNMSKFTLVAAVLGAMICSGSIYFSTTSDEGIPQHVVDTFTAWKSVHGKAYASVSEHNFRLSAFHENWKNVQEHNAMNLGSTLGMNKFADLTKAEFKKQYLGFKPAANRVRPPKKVRPYKTTVQSKDWRLSGAVTAVKDQGQCGSCWAFSATEAIETGYFFGTGLQKELAPQQITSCDSSDLGCNGGDPLTAYEYVESIGGIETEAAYPYTSGNSGDTGNCYAQHDQFEAKINSYSTISSRSYEEDDMMQEIQTSPMSVCVDAETWQLYMGGVVTSATCGTELDHCVQAVGYDAENNYWIVRNSWNTDWGNEGYIYVEAGTNACGIAQEATTVDATSY